MSDLNLDKKSKYLLACSFGPDSMALFYMLISQGYDFECAIVNYHLREESTSEVDGLLKYASKYGVKVHTLDYKEPLTKNKESKCREIRYSFFADLFSKNSYDALLVAHHQDDKIETYLMQKQRQNCPIYYGINDKTTIKGMKVIRPLLAYSKKELMEYCLKNNVPFAVDKTNSDISILRNKIRHQIVGKMTDQDRRNILEEIDRRNAELQKMINSIELERINEVDYLKSLDENTFKYAINFLVKRLGDNQSLSKENVGEIKKIILSKKPNVFSRVKKGAYFVKEYDYVDFADREIESIDYSFVLNEPGVLDTEYFYLDFTKDTSNRNVKVSDYPLTIRNVRPSDYIYIKNNKISARRLLIDWKMPLSLRQRWPIILDKNDVPLYIPRYQKDFVPSKNINFFVKL